MKPILEACGLASREVDLPPDAWRALDAMARETGRPVGDILAEIVAQAAEDEGRPWPRTDLPRRA